MSAASVAQPPAPDLRELTMDVHLRDVRELLTVEEFDPFVPNAPTQSGVEQIKSAAQNMKMPDKINLALYLPSSKLEQNTLDAIHAALTRYCAYRDREAQTAIAALKREAIIELRVGAIAAQNPVASVLSALPSLMFP